MRHYLVVFSDKSLKLLAQIGESRYLTWTAGRNGKFNPVKSCWDGDIAQRVDRCLGMSRAVSMELTSSQFEAIRLLHKLEV